MRRPLVIDLFCGLGGWTTGFLSEGWDAIGFDIKRHVYGPKRYPAQLVLQDVLTLDGWQFRGRADMIVASPPCQKYSYMAMPWSLAKRAVSWQRWERDSPFGDRLAGLNALFDACFRIAREAELPIVVENVKGAQPWVGRAQANFGSYYLWGDIANVGGRIVRPDALVFGMPSVKALRQLKQPGRNFHFPEKYGIPSPSFHGAGAHFTSRDCGQEALKVPGINWSGYGKPGYKPQGFNVTAAQRYRAGHADVTGTKVSGDWFGSYAEQKAAGTIPPGRMHGKNSDSRKAASAMIAEIPLELASHIARVFRP